MRRSALRRATTSWVVLSICALLLGSGIVGTTFATFNAETSNPNSTFAGGWLGASSAGSVTAVGNDVQLSWTAPTSGGQDGQSLYGVDNGTSSNCTGASYASLAAIASASTSSYTDANRATGTNNGHWFCYQMVSTLTGATNWKTAYSFTGLQIGLAATGLSITNGGSSGAVDSGDQIAITFNQATNLTSLSGVLTCTFTDGTIIVGDTGACTSSSDSYTFGKLTASNNTLGSAAIFASASISVSGAVATVTLAGAGSAAVTGTPTWTFTPSSSILSSAVVDQATACTAAATTCRPTVASSF